MVTSLVLIAQAIFLLECGQTVRHTHTNRPTDRHTRKVTDATDTLPLVRLLPALLIMT